MWRGTSATTTSGAWWRRREMISPTAVRSGSRTDPSTTRCPPGERDKRGGVRVSGKSCKSWSNLILGMAVTRFLPKRAAKRSASDGLMAKIRFGATAFRCERISLRRLKLDAERRPLITSNGICRRFRPCIIPGHNSPSSNTAARG